VKFVENTWLIYYQKPAKILISVVKEDKISLPEVPSEESKKISSLIKAHRYFEWVKKISEQ
jgi:hypothetical protein